MEETGNIIVEVLGRGKKMKGREGRGKEGREMAMGGKRLKEGSTSREGNMM